ncbi:TMEM192 family [Cinara cedri]|uniref:Transmembrane protein 192 n=1 Tax=Cinara cedri TaxID=506608 RepID=A0A5E4MEF1_9HEMI|nr:TMEM192 family [Cinara cedri]
MDIGINDNTPSTNVCANQRCCIPSSLAVDCDSMNSSEHLLEINDHTTLISDFHLKKKKKSYFWYSLSDTNIKSSQLWITFIHILCTGCMALVSLYLVSNFLIFEENSNGKEDDNFEWNLLNTDHYSITIHKNSSTIISSKDNCEPLYILVYIHCCVWFIFLILDYITRHIHNKMLRSRGHLRAHGRLCRLAAIPFQLVSLWTVLLAIFITIYAQEDKSNFQPYCEANFIMSPKNGIAILLVVEFVIVTLFSLLYANSIRKFNLEKPPPDVCGWQEGNFDRWTPPNLNSNATTNELLSSREFSNYDQQDERCLLDVLEYYSNANRQLTADLGRASQRLRELESHQSEL